ncbi:MAG: ATP-binding protein, partial [Acidobacteria bacterium]|nr:ATP-binding protein [Acidobacteriota bacterium]
GKLERGQIEFDFRSCVESAGDILAPKAHAKGLELAILVHPDVPECLVGDPGRLRQVLINLVGNAIKFTADGEVSVEVTVESRRGERTEVRVAVADTGIGISQDRIGSLFQSFSQVDASTTRKFGGTGLGLAMARKIVEAHGGRITIHNGESGGARVCFDLPVFPMKSQGGIGRERTGG